MSFWIRQIFGPCCHGKIICKCIFCGSGNSIIFCINIAPGERYTVLYKLTDPGVWAWHCHILTHAERDDGMFGMVTAFVVAEA